MHPDHSVVTRGKNLNLDNRGIDSIGMLVIGDYDVYVIRWCIEYGGNP